MNASRFKNRFIQFLNKLDELDTRIHRAVTVIIGDNFNSVVVDNAPASNSKNGCQEVTSVWLLGLVRLSGLKIVQYELNATAHALVVLQ
jgi:hypothetical protein